MTSLHGIITLNVGGTIFETTYNTLQQYPESIFCTSLLPKLKQAATTMIDQQQQPPTLFIDRSPHYFEIILQFLRTNKLVLPPSTSTEWLQALLDEALFFQLDSLVSLLHARCQGYKDIITSKSFVWPPGMRKIIFFIFCIALPNIQKPSITPDITREQAVHILLSHPVNSTVRFRGVCLATYDLSRFDFTNCNLNLSVLVKSKFEKCDMTDVSMVQAQCDYSIFDDATFLNSTLNYSVFRFAHCINCQFYKVNMENVDLANANLQYSSFRECNLSKVNLSHANLSHTTWFQVNCSSAQFYKCNMSNCTMEKVILDDAVLDSASMSQTTLKSCLLPGTHFEQVQLQDQVMFISCEFRKALYHMDTMKKANVKQSRFYECDWSGQDLRYKSNI